MIRKLYVFSKFKYTIVLNLNWCFRQSSLALWVVMVYSVQTVVCVYMCGVYIHMCIYMYCVCMCVYMCCVYMRMCICVVCVCGICLCVQGKASVKSWDTAQVSTTRNLGPWLWFLITFWLFHVQQCFTAAWVSVTPIFSYVTLPYGDVNENSWKEATSAMSYYF